MKIHTIILNILCYILASNSAFAQDPQEVLNNMITASAKVRTLRLDMYMNERIKDKNIEKTTQFKIQYQPYKVYFKQKYMGLQLEGWYEEGKNKNLANVSTIGFPWLNMNLDLNGSKMRDYHHHTIKEAGFNYFIDLIKHQMDKYPNEFNKMLSYQGKAKRNNKDCIKLIINNPHFKMIYYKVLKNETLPTIAKKLHVNDYMILERNEKLTGYDDVKEGQVIMVPTVYCKKIELYIDIKSNLPISIITYDDLGFYAEYSFLETIVNPIFKDDEFLKK